MREGGCAGKGKVCPDVERKAEPVPAAAGDATAGGPAPHIIRRADRALWPGRAEERAEETDMPARDEENVSASSRRRGGRKARRAAHVVRAAPGGRIASGGTGGLLVIACGALAREIRSLVRLNGWDHVTLLCLPADLHLVPEKIPDAVAATVEANRGRFAEILVAYGDCGTGGELARRCAALGVEMLPGAHCYAFFSGVDDFAARDEPGTFYLTDFLVRQFDAFVWKPLGLDRHPELKDAYFGHYDKLVHLAQMDDPALAEAAAAAAARLGLAFERRFTGFGDLARVLEAAAGTAARRETVSGGEERGGAHRDKAQAARKSG